MTKDQLLTKTKAELLKIAQRLGLRSVTTLRKNDLVDRVFAAQSKPTKVVAKQPAAVRSVARKVSDTIKRRAVRKRQIEAEPDVNKADVMHAGSKKTDKRLKKVPSGGIVTPLKEMSARLFELTRNRLGRRELDDEKLGELPKAYGTERLFLAAQDPRLLYVYWDLTPKQLTNYRGQASDKRLYVRIYERGQQQPIRKFTVGDDSCENHISVDKPGREYRAELGFSKRDGKFFVISKSQEVVTPTDTVSENREATFATIPLEVPFRKMLGIIREHVQEGEQIANALQRLSSAGFNLPFRVGIEMGPWSSEQQTALERILGPQIFHQAQKGSFDISELLRRRLTEEVSSGVSSGFSPAGASWQRVGRENDFWFAVNAELIIYGATEPDAKVIVDGKPIKLRSDGTFSFHFSFPDGLYELPVQANSASGDDQRSVKLSFQRTSATEGKVDKVQQASHLTTPMVT